MSWQADNIQAVLLVPPGAPQPDALAVWQTFFNDTPDGFQRPIGAPNAVSIASGERNNTQTIVTSQIGRIEISIRGTAAAGEFEPPALQDVGAAIETASTWIISISGDTKVFRIAIVANLYKIISKENASLEMTECTGVHFPEFSSDQIYQYNCRRKFSCNPQIDMNRIVTWSYGEQHYVTVPVSASTSGGLQNQVSIKSNPIVSHKIDINTATTFDFNFESNVKMYLGEMQYFINLLIAGKKSECEDGQK